jgi:hypothetical protein
MVFSGHTKDVQWTGTLGTIRKPSKNQKWTCFCSLGRSYYSEISIGTVVETRFGAHKQIFLRIKSKLRRLTDNQ